MDFKNSITKDNLMRAFAGESQARNRYTFAAEQAKKENLYVIECIFKYTADQEKAHAKIFYDHLKAIAGETIHIDGGYPVDIAASTAELLRMAQHNEYEEHDPIYKAFAETAKSEGFDAVAASFNMIAEIEKCHGNRFGRFADFLDSGKLFEANAKTSWICLNCGHIHEGPTAPQVCPVCSHNRGYFLRFELSPFEGTCN